MSKTRNKKRFLAKRKKVTKRKQIMQKGRGRGSSSVVASSFEPETARNNLNNIDSQISQTTNEIFAVEANPDEYPYYYSGLLSKQLNNLWRQRFDVYNQLTAYATRIMPQQQQQGLEVEDIEWED